MQPLYIFISYSRKDTTIANQLARLLERGGHDPFIDRELLPGQKWKDILQKEIDRCDAFVFVTSKASLDSTWCLWEYQEAVNQNKPIFPVKVEDFGNIPETYEGLGDIQILDMSAGVTSDNAVALMGGLFHVRQQENKGIPPQPSRAALRANPPASPSPDIQHLDWTENAPENLAQDDDDGEYDSGGSTEPLTRLPLPMENPLPKGVTAIIKIIQSPTAPMIEHKIITTKFEIGRTSKANLTIREKRISKQHATLYWSNGKFRITDSSLNGTWLNGERLTSNQSYPLTPNFKHRIDLAENYTVLEFHYNVPDD